MSVSSIVRPSISSVAGVSPSTDLSRPSIQLFHPPRLSTTSQQHLNNGCLPSSTLGRLSQAEVLSQTFTVGGHHSSNTNLKCSEILRLKLKYYLLTLTLTILLAFLLIITIELSMQVFHFNPTTTIITNTTINKTIYKTELKIHSYFFCTWIFNFLLLSCFPLQITIYKYCVSKTTTTTIRDLIHVYDSEKSHQFADYCLKTLLLCFLWYSCCYLMIRSLSILKPAETITLYSITVTSRQVLGWIALHEQFIGNKIIAHIVSCTAILFVLHGDGFRFNIFLLGSVMATSSGALKTIFDVILKGIIKDLTNHKLILLMTSICLFGTLLFWPFLLITHFSNIEPFGLYDVNIYTCIGLTITALVFNLLTITIPLVYTEFSIVACLLIVIPAIGLIDRYYYLIHYNGLFIAAMIFSFIGIAIALLPKTLFLHSSKKKKQQHQQGNISAFEEIRAQRRIRNYNLYNEGKT